VYSYSSGNDTWTVKNAGAGATIRDGNTGSANKYICVFSHTSDNKDSYLSYDIQPSSPTERSFTLDTILTGQTSGAEALIVGDLDVGAAGILTLKNVQGIFQDNEALHDSTTPYGLGQSNGTITTGGVGANRPTTGDDHSRLWDLTPMASDGNEIWTNDTAYTSGTFNGTDESSVPSFTHAQHAPPITNGLDAGRYLVINNGIDNIQLYDGVSVFPLRNYYDDAYVYRKAKQTIFFNSVLIQLSPIDGGVKFPHQVLWSAVGDILDWDATSSASNSGLYNLFDTSGVIVRGEIIGDNALAIYKEDAIFTLTPSGTNTVFNVQLNVNGTGLLAYDAIAILEDRHIIISTEGFFIFSGGSTVEPAGRNVWREFIEDLDFDAKERIRTIVDKENTRVKFYFPSRIDGTSCNTRAVVYDYDENWWSLESMEGNVTAVGNYKSTTDRTWIAPAPKGEWNDGTWATQTETWKETKSTSGSFITLFGNSSGYTTQQSSTVYNELKNGSEVSITQTHETKDFTSADIVGQDYQDRYILFQGLILDAKGDSLDIHYSTDEGESWVAIKTNQALTGSYARYKIDFRVTSMNDKISSYFSLRNRLGIRFIPRNR
jgi:hypothetical protein